MLDVNIITDLLSEKPDSIRLCRKTPVHRTADSALRGLRGDRLTSGGRATRRTPVFYPFGSGSSIDLPPVEIAQKLRKNFVEKGENS
jgi:hypothetical protein